MRTSLRYVVGKKIEVTSADAIQYETFRANGLFDPEVSLGGHQPRGFDQMTAIYQTYTVLGSKITVQWAYQGYQGPASNDTGLGTLIKTTSGEDAAAACPPVMVGIHKHTVALPIPSTAAEVMEHSRTSWKAMNCMHQGVSTRQSCNTASYFGKRYIIGAEGFTGDATADPTEQIQYTIWAARTNLVSQGACRLTAFVTIEYDVVFTDQKPLVAS